VKSHKIEYEIAEVAARGAYDATQTHCKLQRRCVFLCFCVWFFIYLLPVTVN